MPPHALHCLIDRPPWRIDLAPGDWGRLVVSFASVGHDPGRVPSPEFVGSATAAGRAALFVSDESRSWANAPGWRRRWPMRWPACRSRRRRS